MKTASLVVVAGEPSGDAHAAEVLKALRTIRPDVVSWGIGGPALRSAGVQTRHDIGEMAVMGLWEVLIRLPFFRRVFREMYTEAIRRKPSAALLVDYPGFNLRFAAALKRHGIPVIYFICPQVWAWHRSRIHTIMREVDLLLVVFPFEATLFKKMGDRVHYVGHPLAVQHPSPAPPPSPPDWGEGYPRIALLPGSRRQEVVRILPVLLSAAKRLSARLPDASFLLAAASSEAAAWSHKIMASYSRRPERLRVMTDATRSVLQTADAAWVTSGTATLEAALQGCPMVVVYRTAALTFYAARWVIRIPYIGLVNIVAERKICPELIQYRATPKALVQAIYPLLFDTPERHQMKQALSEVARKLGDDKAFFRAAERINQFLENTGNPPGSTQNDSERPS